MGRQLKMASQGAEGARIQYAALCWRPGETGVEVLMITSRDTGRWVIPKGWPMPGLAPEAAAAEEAWEEAGVTGQVSPVCLGRYGYRKIMSVTAEVPCAVAVYGLRVERLAETFPEARQRERRWVGQAVAATMVQEPDLARLIHAFVPPVEGRPAPVTGEDLGQPATRLPGH